MIRCAKPVTLSMTLLLLAGCPRDLCEQADQILLDCELSFPGFWGTPECEPDSIEICRAQCTVDTYAESRCEGLAEKGGGYDTCLAACEDPPVEPEDTGSPPAATVPLTFVFEGGDVELGVPEGAFTVTASDSDAATSARTCTNGAGTGCTVDVAPGAVQLAVQANGSALELVEWGACTSASGSATPTPADSPEATVSITEATTCSIAVGPPMDCSPVPFAIAPLGQSTIEVTGRGAAGGPYLPIKPTIDASSGEDRLSFLAPASTTQMRVTFSDPTIVGSHYLRCDWFSGPNTQLGCSFQMDPISPLFPPRFEPSVYRLDIEETVTFGAKPCRAGSITFTMEQEF